MGKAIISNRIYMDLPTNKEAIFNALTYRIITSGTGSGNIKKYQQAEIIRNYKMITPKIISIPQGRTDLIPDGYEIIDKRVLEFADFPVPKFELLDDQKIIYNQVSETSFINALPGWGKTFTALHLAFKFGQKTLVVTHTTALRDQWIEEVEKLFGVKPGVIGGGIFDVDGHPIVIGNVQSIVRCIDRIEKIFGTVIMDEAHHTPASTFTQTIDRMHARYRLALSGTMERKDGKHIMFPDYFGFNVLKPPQNNTVNPVVHILRSNIKMPPGKTWADRITGLLTDVEYQDLIASIALIKSREGHKVLVIADRVNFLKNVAEMLGPMATYVVGETVDRKEEIQKILDGRCNILCGSRQIFSEGISVNILSCLILAIPIANRPTLEQLAGRIMRLAEGKITPVIIDIHFAGRSEKEQNEKRLSLYLEKGWEVKYL